MTVQSYTTSSYATNNSTTEFAFTFEVYDTSEVVVTLRVDSTGAETVLAETTDYDVALTGSDPATGGAITTVATHDTGRTLTISRAGTQTQETDLIAGGEIPADTLEDQFDKLVMLVQELQDGLDRCVKYPITDSPAESYSSGYAEMDDSIGRASTTFTFDSDGLPSFISGTLADDVTTTPFTETLLDDASSGEFQTTLGFSSFIQSLLDDGDQAAAQTTLGLSSIAVLDENDMGAGTGSAVSPPSQDSVYAFVTAGTITLTNKTLTSPTINTGAIVGPVITGAVSGSSFLDEDNMASDSATKLASQQSIKAYADSVVPATPKYAAYSYTVAQNTSGGTATTGSWGTRPIDDEDVDADNIGTLATNKITLLAGTYDFTCHASFFKTNETRLRIRNTTAGTTLSVGVQAFLTSGDLDSKPLSFSGRFTVADNVQALEVQYYCKRTQATNGLGYPMNIASETERYLTIEFWEVP